MLYRNIIGMIEVCLCKSEMLRIERAQLRGGCDWECGRNANGKPILRLFVPKVMVIAQLTAKEPERIEDWVYYYPRRLHGYRTATEMAAQSKAKPSL